MDKAYFEDLFAPFGTVEVKNWFGGVGIVHRGLTFAGVMDGRFCLKADEQTIPEFEAEGMTPWEYNRKDGKVVTMPYWGVPERLLDEPDEFKIWAEKAFDAAIRMDQAKSPKHRKLKQL